MHARMEVESVERWDDRTMLRFTLTSLEDEPMEMAGMSFGVNAGLDGSMRSFRLVDPVGQRRWAPAGPGEIHLYGSDLRDMVWEPGVEYAFGLVYDRLPEDVQAVTVLGSAGLGEFAGVPVADGEPAPLPSRTPPELDEDGPEPSGRVELPMRDIEDGEAIDQEESGPVDVYGVREEAVERTGDGGRETVALRSDVLFDFDADTLDERAGKVLDDVVAETEERADPDKPPITITGHTDGKGTDDYNQDLSERRAEAVKEVLEAELGGGYEYVTEGKGATEPLLEEGGDDDAEARAENRRVEISYTFKQDVEPSADGEAGGSGESEGFQVPVEEAAEPAAFRSPQDAGPAAEAEDPEGEAEIAVYPFYRDGAFLVARFDITNTGDRLSATSDFYGDRRGGFPEFSVQDPASGTIYRQARLGGTGDDRYLLGNEPWPVVLDPGLPNHGVAYFTAPPGDLTEAVFDAGPFGKLTVPVEE
ncbi:OmpA family protein [Nocardiopsis composta]|uniref:Outer membrane protein OmpA-like peptidoglycan-associated protein n=1 Tax=Nocardiopsis composta TaxID=157465 RepID=A0A7W8QMA7_9ACTN|nr:OmpA family protein [Nocardiopsis composta]MBB5432408.1 outer membrane protein OmpA-like peptidoglycan-associated protein [Nocardiopsis composta]